VQLRGAAGADAGQTPVPFPGVTSLTFSTATGKLLWIDSGVHVFDPQTERTAATFRLPVRPLRAVLTPDGRHLLVLTDDNVLHQFTIAYWLTGKK
jgi:hypothetical protein